MCKTWVLFLAMLPCGCQKASSSAESSVSDQKPSVSFRWVEAKPFRDASSIGAAEVINVAFVDSAHIAIGVLFASLPNLNAGTRFRETIRRTAVVAVVNANDGHVEASKTWNGLVGEPAFENKMELHSTASGNLLVGVGDTVYLLSSGLAEKAKRQLPLNTVERNGYSYHDMWSVRVSPTGKRAVMISTSPAYEVKDHWIAPDTLKERSEMSAPKYSLVQILDDFIVFNENTGQSDVVQIQSGGNAPRPLCATCEGAVSCTFGQNGVFISTKPAASYTVVNSSGQRLFAANRGSDPDRIHHCVGATVSNRVAFEYGYTQGMASLTNFSVLDVALKREVWSLEISEDPRGVGGIAQQFTTPQLALAPNGDSVAILTSDTLSVYVIK